MAEQVGRSTIGAILVSLWAAGPALAQVPAGASSAPASQPSAVGDADRIEYYIAKQDWDSLVQMGKVATPRLIDALKDKDPIVRGQCAYVLGMIGDQRAIRPLVTAMWENDDADEAADALRRIGFAPEVSNPMLRSSLEIPSTPAPTRPDVEECVLILTKAFLRQQAEEQIVGMGKVAVDPLCRILRHAKERGHTQTGARAAKALGLIGDPRAVELLVAVADKSDFCASFYINEAGSYPVTTAAADALGLIGDKSAVPKLLELLDYKGAARDVWAACCRALAKIGDDRAIDAIGKLMQRELPPRAQYDTWFEEDACNALASFGPKSANVLAAILKNALCPRLGEQVTEGVEREIRLKAACKALGDIGDKRAVKPLCDALSYRISEVQLAAIEALRKLQDGLAVEPLIAVLEDEKNAASVRAAAADALGSLRNERAIKPLIGVLRDSDSALRERAAKALDALGWKP